MVHYKTVCDQNRKSVALLLFFEDTNLKDTRWDNICRIVSLTRNVWLNCVSKSGVLSHSASVETTAKSSFSDVWQAFIVKLWEKSSSCTCSVSLTKPYC